MGLSTKQGVLIVAGMFAAYGAFAFATRAPQPPVAAPATPTTMAPPTTTEHTPVQPAAAPRPRAPESLAEAIAAYRPEMDDTQEKLSQGAKRLIAWSLDRLTWRELQEVKETSIALVAKDSDEERGRRLCVSGSVIEIRAQRVDELKIYDGGIHVGGDVVRFTALGSSGAIVAHGWARFCGIVTGVFSYSNTGGGTTHAIHAVGMFDLPENKPPVPAAPNKPAGPKPDPSVRVWDQNLPEKK